MRGLKRIPWLSGLGALAFLAVSGNMVRAEVTTDKAGSILIFPKVIADGTRDTLIQIVNTDTKMNQVHCFYVNASGACNSNPAVSCQLNADCIAVSQNQNDFCDRTCDARNFDAFLTAGQPTVWRVSTGRFSTPTDPRCQLGQTCACTPGPGAALNMQSCPGTDPGLATNSAPGIPPVVPGFSGELKCVSVGGDFVTPAGTDKLIGTAVLENLSTGQVSEYNALAIKVPDGAPGPGINSDLLLDNSEYNRCPDRLILSHWADGATDPRTGATINTELTLAPCTEMLESDPGDGTRSRALFEIYDEFETFAGSADITFDCHMNRRLSALNTVFGTGNLASLLAKTRIRSPNGKICLTGTNRGATCTLDSDCPNAAQTTAGTSMACREWTGLVGVAEEFHSQPGQPTGTAAFNLHVEDGRSSNDLIDLGL